MRKLLYWLLLFDSKVKLRNKILISFVMILLIPSACIGFFSYQKSSMIIRDQTSYAYSEVLRQTAINISYRLTEVENISEIIYSNEKLQGILRRANRQELTIGDVIGDYKSIIEIIKNLEKSRNILRIRLMVPNDPLYAMENENILGLSKDDLNQWNQELIRQPGFMEWKYSKLTSYLDIGDKSTVSLFRLMKDFEDVNRVLGLVAIDVEQKTLTNVLQNMNLTLPYQALLYNNLEIITSYTQLPEQIDIDQQALHEMLQKDVGEEQPFKNVRFQGKDYLYLTQKIDNMEWEIGVLLPSIRITDQSRFLGIYILLVSISLIAVTIGLSILLSNRITKRLYALVIKMKGIEQGHFGEVVEINGQDEISVLQGSFNRMSLQISTLINEVYTITINKQREEMKVLEGRINSHFLYNTLDSVKWMAIEAKAPEIAKLVTNLSKFYRISLNRGQDMVSVEKELEHVKAYVDIQNTRFSGNIRFEIEVDTVILSKQIIKLILQPIVENAILHGINKAKSKQGSIMIRGLQRKDGIVFYISDDGVGMNKVTLETLLLAAGTGYGVQNVNQRLQLYYGSGSGVKIRSSLGKGTVVRLLLRSK